ncbi:Methylglutaconyl-CoA hydratase [hydrothermal vent metagenome]|uniref:Methylglutaconyl-CoA hydratase n=1 Tax=hydrothermal vent metagenome TaxID=652676 RepID=A0A3B0S9E6_9ZZZZ
MADFQTIKLKASPGGVAVIIINRPEKHNAFTAQVIDELADAFETVRTSNCRVLLLRGAGKSFSAGADLNWMKAAAQYSKAENEADALKLAQMLHRLADLPMMTIACVQGACMGGGVGLAAACDVVVAQQSAMFRFSEVRLGLTPGTISPFVIRAIGPRWANALFVSAESFDAEFAAKIGLVHYTVKDETEMEDMVETLSKMAWHTAPGAVADAKKLVREVSSAPIDETLMHKTAKHIAMRRASKEGKEGLNAFLEKRKPNWAE